MDVNAELARLQGMLAQGQLSQTDFEMYRAQLLASAGYPPQPPQQPGFPPQQPGYPPQPGVPGQPAAGGSMTKWIVIAIAVIAVLGFVYKSQQAKQDQPTAPTQAPAGGTGPVPGGNPGLAPAGNPGANPGTAPAGGGTDGAPGAPAGPVAAGDNPLLGTWAADPTPAQCAGSKFMFGPNSVDFIAPATQMQPQHFDGVTYTVKGPADVAFDIPGKGPSEVTLAGGGFQVGPCVFRKQG